MHKNYTEISNESQLPFFNKLNTDIYFREDNLISKKSVYNQARKSDCNI